MQYFKIESQLGDNLSPAVPRGTNLRRPGGCLECSTIPKDCGPPEVLRVKTPLPGGVVSSTSWGFGVIAAEFLDVLGNEAASCLRLGNLADANGQIIKEFRTFVGVERILLRGNLKSEHWICSSCGACIYVYTPRESPYVTTFEVKSCRPVYEIESMRLLVNETIRERIGDRWAEALTFNEVPILDSPLDGLPVEMGLWPTAEQVEGYQPNLPKWKKT